MKPFIPYGKQSIDKSDVEAVIEALRSDFITTGPKVSEFEKAVCDFTGAKFAVAVSSGTAALHCAMFAAGIKEGDDAIVTPMTFAASANAILYCGGTPVFADVIPETLLINPDEVGRKITSRTKAVVAVDYAGQPCDYDALKDICDKRGLFLISDACHSIGAEYKGRKTGTLADMTVFSFHPVKHITTGEGGMILTDNADFAAKMRIFRNHGITTDYRQREEKGSWFYEMEYLGYNYRITDFQCALGISQLKKLPGWIDRRREIACIYDKAFRDNPSIVPIKKSRDVSHAYHLYVVRVESADRNSIFTKLRNAGIGVNVHYIPVHLHPYYRKTFGTGEGMCPIAEKAYGQIISLPIFPGLKDEDLKYVIDTVKADCARNPKENDNSKGKIRNNVF
jgi:perosamine synthetase